MATKTEKFLYSITGIGIGIGISYLYTKAKKEEFTLGKALSGGVIGLGAGYLAAEIWGEPNDTVNYTHYHRGKRVYEGICYEDRLDHRIAEHERAGKKFDSVWYDHAKPRSEAQILERNRIRRFRCKNNIQHNY